jgi:hypothetical protein
VRQDRIVANIAVKKRHVSNRLHRQDIDRKDSAPNCPLRPAPESLPNNLGPTPRRSAQINHRHSGSDQAFFVIDPNELKCCSRAVMMLLGQLDIRIVDMVVQPGFAESILRHSASPTTMQT